MKDEKNLLDERMDKDMDLGYQLGIDVLDELGFATKENPSREHFVGILSSFFSCMYHTQSEMACNDVIEFCKDMAIKQIKECRGDGT